MNKIIRFFFLLTSLTATAQTEIQGKIIEKETQSPLEFAEIVLIPEQSSDLTGAITDEQGVFHLKVKPGSYTFQVTYVGQKLYEKQLTLAGKVVDLGTIEIKNSNELDEVIIEAKKKLIERKIDRLVFNVANSSKASQGDVIEVLKVTPGVRVENDKITMIGKGNLQVMIDDKIVRLSGSDLINFLRSLASEDIQSIEVINNPPAKYEASGNSGLINIVLKKAKKDSWNALLKGTYFQRTKPNYRTSGTFNFNKDKISITSRFGYIRHMAVLKEEVTANFPDGRWYTSTPVYIDLEGFVATADLSYQITPKWEMGGQYYFNGTLAQIDVLPVTLVSDYESNKVTRSLRSSGYEPQHPRRHIVNFNNKIDLDKPGRKIILNLDYFRDFNPDGKNYEGTSVIQEPYSKQYYKSINLNKKLVENYSAKLDVEYPMQWIDLDFGGKISHSISSSDISFFNSGLSDQPIEETPLQMNDFTYKEDIGALYLSTNRKFGDKWSAKFGLRMEHSQIDTQSDKSNLSHNNDYTDLFPTFYLSYNATEDSNFSLNYSRRIERPEFYHLNPNVYYQSPFRAMEGNPFLQPAFIHNVELSNIYKNFVTKFYYSYENNLFSEIPLPDANTNITRLTVENYINRNRIGFSENYTFDAIDWWSSNNNLNINYSEATFDLEEEQPAQTGFNAMISTNNDFNLNAEKTIIAGLNYWYRFPGVDGVFKTRATSALGLSLQFFLLKKDLNITLRGNDLFKNSVERKTTNINGVFQKLRNSYDTRQFWLTVSYKFGNKLIKEISNDTGNQEEKNRI